MFKHSQKRFLPSLALAAVIAVALAACGGSDDSSSGSDLAAYIPADAPLYVEGAIQPEGDVAANVDAITEKLTGKSLGDTIKEGIASSGQSEIDFEADVEPWLGESAGVFVEFDLGDLSSGSMTSAAMAGDPASGADAISSGDNEFGLVAETTDVDAAEAFIEKVSEEDGQATDGEYEGFSYKVSGDGDSVAGIVDDNLVAAATEDAFKAMVDASKGDSLKDTDAYSEVAGKAADGSLVDLYLANDPLIASSEGSGFDLGGLYGALGMDVAGTGTMISLVPGENEISIRGVNGSSSELESGDASELIRSFPADTIFAFGSGDVGANATKLIDALNQEGIEGALKPGDLDRTFKQLSEQGIDVKSLIGDLETVGLFVNGDSARNLGGALVATSSDIKPIENSIKTLSTLISFGNAADVKPLGGGMTGLRIRVPQLQGRPVVVAVGDDRLVIAVGMQAARHALNGGGQSLADSPAFQAAEESLPGDGIDVFGDPAALTGLISGFAGGDPSAEQATEILGKFQYLAGGSGEEDDSFELNLGLTE